jgi:hypothetical protein
MNCNNVRDKINDYLDGLLPEKARAKVDEHLEHCQQCREEHGRLKELLETARSLPRNIMPDRDLWPDIENVLQKAQPGRSFLNGFRAHPAIFFRAIALAAAVLVIVFSATFITIALRNKHISLSSALEDNSSTGLPVSAVESDYSSAEAEYLRAVQNLQAVLNTREQYLSSETRAVIDRNIKTINDAVTEIRNALGKNPGNRQLHTLLMASYQNKIELMYWAAKLSMPDAGRP